MPIQRTASLPVPSDAIAQARRELAPRYGAQVWDGPDRRVLLVRVPRREPDPVNDVEEAVEFLNQADAKEITHCLLVGDEAVAQVYARPLQDLMLERESFDRRTAASWRQRLPGHLAHVVFQAPDDPRRRWRLAVRLPLDTVRDLQEEILEDLADGLGAELESQRMGQVVAVYLIASHDDVRLEADMFLQELRAKWQSEDARRRKALAQAQREAEERRKQEQERRQVLQEMEARLKRRPGGQATAPGARSASRDRPHIPYAQGGASAAAHPLEATPDRHQTAGPTPSDRPGTLDVEQARDALGERVGRLQAAGGPQRTGIGERPLAEATTTIRAREPTADAAEPAWTPGGQGSEGGVRRRPLGKRVPHRVQELRARVDEVLGGRGATAGRVHATDPWLAPAASSETEGTLNAGTGGDAGTSTQGAEVGHAAVEPEPVPGPAAHDITGKPPLEIRPVLRGLKERLECAGFETIVAPATEGHVIDLAAERPEGTVRRVVVRAVDRLDEDVAKELLKTARELEVDLVLCVAETTVHEALRLLVATKVEVTRPEDLDAIGF